MIDPKLITEKPDLVEKTLRLKKAKVSLAELQERQGALKEAQKRIQELEAGQNAAAKEMGKLKASDPAEFARRQEGQKKIREDLKALEGRLAEAQAAFEEKAAWVPNPPLPEVPEGPEESHNQVLDQAGPPPRSAKGARSHDELGERLGIYDAERGSRLAGARFSVLWGEGARLERALIQFMLDHHRARGYTEVSLPYLGSEETLFASAQLPKMREDMFHVPATGHFLLPTAEVGLMSLHRDEILEEKSLPRLYVAYTPAFRKEAGAYGRDTKGLIRQHQFHKVELFSFCRPEDSPGILEKIRKDAASVLEALELPHRSVLLSTEGLTFASAKTYDLEVWMPGQEAWREISSCSSCTDFQSRRAKTRFRRGNGGKPELLHSLNGSGLAVGRCWAAILENNQREDGCVDIPKVLRPYMGGRELIQHGQG